MHLFEAEIFLLFLVNVISLKDTLVTRSTQFSLQTDLNDLLFNYALLLQTTVHSPNACSVRCMNFAICASFQIHEEQNQCRLYWTHFLMNETGSFSVGWRTFSDIGPCKTGYLYSRQYGYCLRYVGQLRGQEMIEVCEKNDEELIKVNSLEENNFVSGLAFSLMQDPIGTRRLLIDGLFSSGKWISMFGNGSRLIFTNFYAGNGIPEENHIITMFTGNLTHFSEFKWRSKSGKFLRRSVICRYYP